MSRHVINKFRGGKGSGTNRPIKPKDTSGGILGQYTGTIQRRGAKFGFIDGGDEFDEPVFVLADELRAYKEGQIVKFTAYVDEQGKVSATELKSGLSDGKGKGGKPSWDAARIPAIQVNIGATAFSTKRPIKPNKPKDTSGGVLGEYTGTIQRRGAKFGFIGCDEFDEPVFVLADELRAYKEGQIVKFTAYVDEQEKVSAKDLKSGLSSGGNSKGGKANKGLAIALPGHAVSGSKGKGSKGKGSKGKPRRIKPKDTSGGELGESTGTIKRRGRKFGFIECEDYEEPVFVLGDELKDYEEGQVVKFTAYMDEQEKVSAKDLKSGSKSE